MKIISKRHKLTDKISYSFLEGPFGKKILKKYNSKVKQDYGDNKNLKVLNFNKGVVKGSNVYSTILIDKILSEKGLRTATPVDIQRIIFKYGKNTLSKIYLDLGLILRTEDFTGTPLYLPRQLGKQAKDRDYYFLPEHPLVFKSSDLELIVDNHAKDGLGFKLKDSATPFNVSGLASDLDRVVDNHLEFGLGFKLKEYETPPNTEVLGCENNNIYFKNIGEPKVPFPDEFYIPYQERLRSYEFKCYLRTIGLSRFFLKINDLPNSWDSNLADSDDSGRIIVVKDSTKINFH